MQLTNKSGELSLGGLVDLVQNFEDATSMSLFQYTKRSTINSRVFIEKSLAGEEILNHVLLNMMNLYTGLIMTAMDMNRYVQGTKKVRDAMSIVATEGFAEEYIPAQESLNSFFLGNNTQMLSKNARMAIVRSDGSEFGDGNDASSFGNPGGSSVTDLEPKNANLPTGRSIKINFGGTSGDGKTNSFTIDLFLQLLPSFIPTEVVSEFVAMNFTPSIRQRWMQVKAGEISMVKDLILGQDLRKRRMEAMKKDKTGALRDMKKRQDNALANSWLKLALVTPERQNIANTILIYDKATFDRACSRAGRDFKNYNSRQQFFNKTFSMMVCVIDPMFEKIQMYYHGLNAVSEFTYDQMRRNSKTEATDLMSIMKMYAQGMAPKI